MEYMNSDLLVGWIQRPSSVTWARARTAWSISAPPAKPACVNRFDDVCEGGLQVAVAQGEKIESVGVVVDGGFSFDVEAVHDRLGTAPVEEGFFDLLAVRMFADGTFAGVALEGGGFGPFGAADGRFAT